MMRLALVVVTLTLFLCEVASLGNVLELGPEFLARKNDGNMWFVKFYAPWCGYCKRVRSLFIDVFAETCHKWPFLLIFSWANNDGGLLFQLEPIWSELEKKVRPLGVTVARIDATMHEYLASQFEIRGFPTLIFFKGYISRGKLV